MLFRSLLLVEDDTSHAYLIRRVLTPHCENVIHVRSLGEALTILGRQVFDGIITDLHLPDSLADNTAIQILHHSNGSPVIVLTSSTSLKDAVGALQAGAQDFIVKNFDDQFGEILSLSLLRINASLQLSKEKRRAEERMMAFQSAIEKSSDGFAVIDSTGKVLYENSAFTRFTHECGGRPADMMNLFSEKVISGKNLQETLRRNIIELSSGSVWQTEVTFQGDRSRAYDLILSAVPGGYAEGKVECVVWVRDISPMKARERFQREILSTTTHDLKGPLGAILLSAQLLAENEGIQGKEKDLVIRIESSAQGVINMIDEFLSARRIQEGTFLLRPVLSHVGGLLEEALSNFQAAAKTRAITLHANLEEWGAIQWMVDPLAFVRVISNLVSNAIKFTPKGGSVWVEGQVSERELIIDIRDTGAGMDSSNLHQLFESFSRLDQHATIAGTGLGLFIVKSIVSAHGGKVEVVSKVREGSQFTLRFPKDPPVNDRGELILLDFLP